MTRSEFRSRHLNSHFWSRCYVKTSYHLVSIHSAEALLSHLEKISGIYSNENNGFSILFWVILLPVERLRARFINVNKLKMSDILKTEAFRKYKNDLKVDNNHYSIDCSHGWLALSWPPFWIRGRNRGSQWLHKSQIVGDGVKLIFVCVFLCVC